MGSQYTLQPVIICLKLQLLFFTTLWINFWKSFANTNFLHTYSKKWYVAVNAFIHVTRQLLLSYPSGYQKQQKNRLQNKNVKELLISFPEGQIYDESGGRTSQVWDKGDEASTAERFQQWLSTWWRSAKDGGCRGFTVNLPHYLIYTPIENEAMELLHCIYTYIYVYDSTNSIVRNKDNIPQKA